MSLSIEFFLIPLTIIIITAVWGKKLSYYLQKSPILDPSFLTWVVWCAIAWVIKDVLNLEWQTFYSFTLTPLALLVAQKMLEYTEESKTLELRANLWVLGGGSLIMLASLWVAIDALRANDFVFKIYGYDYYINYYYIIIGVLALIALNEYHQISTWSDKVTILLVALLFGRFVAGVAGAPWEWFSVLYTTFLYYAIFNIAFIEDRLPLRVVYMIVTALALIPLCLAIDFVRTLGYYAMYIACLYIAVIIFRYIWNLEFKRRSRCPHCSGWGSVSARPFYTPWWAVGKKYSPSNNPCPKCEGKGWKYRYDDLLHQ